METHAKPAGPGLALAARPDAPELLEAVQTCLINDGLLALRTALESPTKGPNAPTWARPTIGMEITLPWPLVQKILEDGRVWWTSALDWIAHALTRGVLLEADDRGDRPKGYRLPRPVLEWLDAQTGTRPVGDGILEGPEDDQELRRRLVDVLSNPARIGADLLAPDAFAVPPDLRALVDDLDDRLRTPRLDGPPPRFVGHGLDVVAGGYLWPLRFAPGTQTAWFPLVVGLLILEGDPAKAGPEALDDMWAALLRGEHTQDLEVAPAPRPRRSLLTIWDGPTRRDRTAGEIVGILGEGGRLPRNWGATRKWDDLVKAEIEDLQDRFGDDALEPGPDGSPALLKEEEYRQVEPGNFRRVLGLTKHAQQALELREGPRGFRRTFTFRGGSSRREFVMKSWPVPGKAKPARIAIAVPREILEEARGRGTDQTELFDTLPGDLQGQTERAFRRLSTLQTTQQIADYVLARFGNQGWNPVRIPAQEFRVLLENEGDPDNGARVVFGALLLLREMTIQYDGLGELGATSLVLQFHLDEKTQEWSITLSDRAIGCLNLFKSARGATLSSRRTPECFRWTKRIPKAKGEGLNYVKGFLTVAPYLDQARGLTPAQCRLRAWIENEITRNADPAAKDRADVVYPEGDPGANDPRVYTKAYCHLLVRGVDYHGALGHFHQNPEAGRKLAGRQTSRTKTGGGRPGGFLEVLRYDLPTGRADGRRGRILYQALQDMRKVVCDPPWNGVVAGRYQGEWISVDNALLLDIEALAQIPWSLFLRADWIDRSRRFVEDYHAGRGARGETDVVVQIRTAEAPQPPPEAPTQDNPAPEPVAPPPVFLKPHQRLHGRRTAEGLTQAAAAALFGISQQIYSRWESGKADVPWWAEAAAFAWVNSGQKPSLDVLTRAREGAKADPKTAAEDPV